MPLSKSGGTTEREFADDQSRAWSDWIIGMLYRLGIVTLPLAAAGIAAYAFTVSFPEGARAIIFFALPAMWGAYALATLDGQPPRARPPRGEARRAAGTVGEDREQPGGHCGPRDRLGAVPRHARVDYQ